MVVASGGIVGQTEARIGVGVPAIIGSADWDHDIGIGELDNRQGIIRYASANTFTVAVSNGEIFMVYGYLAA
jgi:hypothetical protein